MKQAWFYPFHSGRRYATQAEATAFEQGFADYRAMRELPADPPPLTPERQAFRDGWYCAEKRDLDNS